MAYTETGPANVVQEEPTVWDGLQGLTSAMELLSFALGYQDGSCVPAETGAIKDLLQKQWGTTYGAVDGAATIIWQMTRYVESLTTYVATVGKRLGLRS